ncbi:MAG: Rrf2 family transcriptional regulator [Candidatus Latescibacterota bacterium]
MISVTAQHALRAMAALAAAGPDRAMPGREISAASGVPPKFLSKILLDLNRAGMVSAVRGTGGGYRLQRPAEQIALLEIVDLFDRGRTRPTCMLSADTVCADESACRVHQGWKQVRETYLGFLRTTRLSALVEAAAGRDGRAEVPAGARPVSPTGG